MTSPAFPEPPAAIEATPIDALDAAVARVAERKDDWIRTGLPQRIAYLRQCLDGVNAVAADWVRDICRVKGVSPDEPLAGEEWLSGPVTTARNIRLLIEALEAGGQPKPPKLETRASGQHVATVFPATTFDKLLFAGFRAEVWIEPGKPPSQGRIYREPAEQGRVGLVLGAGNITSIPPMDVLYKLFVENEVVVLKMNPVNEVIGPHLERAFKSLVDAGLLAIVYGGAEVGSHLASHSRIDTLHVTGSDRTYDAIVWGSDPEERKRRKAAGDPINPRPFTAELGCVTPVMVVPGEWSDGDLDFQAHHVAAMVTHNASFNCNAAKVLVVAKGWPQRDAFLRQVEAHLARIRPRKAYYPGAQDRYRAFVEHYPQAKAVGANSQEDVVPWTVIPGVEPKAGEYALTQEAFCGVLAVVELDVASPDGFLDRAVELANEACWGTLSCMLIADDATQKRFAAELDQAVERLHYGGIGVNVWPGVIYALTSPTWGAFPGHTPADIQSGAGVVHNTFLFDHPQKSVLRAPFRIRPTPAWFPDNKNLHKIGERMLRFESKPSLGRVVRLAGAALRG